MTDPSRPPRSFTITLPRKSPWLVAGGFVFGILLFVLVWLGARDKQFYRADGGVAADSDVPLAELPVPLPGNVDTHLPPASEVADGQQPRLVEAPAAPTPPPASAPAAAASDARPATETLSPPAPAETPPQRIVEQSPPPQYPASALRSGQSGSVLLDVMVDAQGRPARVNIARRSGSRALDRAAVQAVEKWRFTPATVNGQPVPGQVQVPIDFTP